MRESVVGLALLVIGAVVAGPAAAYFLDRIPQRWRRTAQWSLIGGAALFAVLADLTVPGPVRGRSTYILAILPGLITYLAFRTLVASTFVSFAPLYFVIGDFTRERVTRRPELPLDRAIPVEPAWTFVYLSLYVFIIILPVLVVRQRDLFRRGMQGYLTVMLIAYAGFLLYPTVAPIPAEVPGDDFAAWSLRLIYDIDLPYNCFPSLHVAYSFVAAFTCYRVHRGVGLAAAAWAALIGVSTLYTKQHYAADVIVGALLAYIAHLLFIRRFPRDAIPERDTRRAPSRALVAVWIFIVMATGLWIAYKLDLE